MTSTVQRRFALLLGVPVVVAVTLFAISVLMRSSAATGGLYIEVDGDRSVALDAMTGVDIVFRTDGGPSRDGVAGQFVAYDERSDQWAIRVLLFDGISSDSLAELIASAKRYESVTVVREIPAGQQWPDCRSRTRCEAVEPVCRSLGCSLRRLVS